VVSAKASRAPETTPSTDLEALLDPNGEFELVARPATPTAGVTARAVLVQGGTPRPWTPPIDVSTEGAVRIYGPTKSLFPETRGAYEIVVLVGRKGTLPSESEAALATAETHPSLQVIRTRVRFAGQP
ncbi:MAG TPA: hypothetical protein VM580_02650, partial [Labilithrix sp.]|nr:hypothetical protein [Labilithrix sp.]